MFAQNEIMLNVLLTLCSPRNRDDEKIWTQNKERKGEDDEEGREEELAGYMPRTHLHVKTYPSR